MKPQSYQNHIRFYTPHHFVFYPTAILLLAVVVYFSFSRPEKLLWIFIGLVLVMLLWLSFMMRQHYALTLQNRIVRLEVKMRYFTLTGKRMEDFESELRDSQLFALRFADDKEFVALAESARLEHLSGDALKKNIRNWKADHHRV